MSEQVEKILVENGLDFNIEKIQLIAPNNGVSILTDYYGLLNTKSGEIIHSVKKGYTPSQNRDIVGEIGRAHV